ncbi:MAG TPA: phosphatase PAP2 family protein [Bacteroidota bacterium]|nr:phosphatase PAP2 family protein [Bacteroidota bacterium]
MINRTICLAIGFLLSTCGGKAQDVFHQDTATTGALPGIVYSDGKEFFERTVHHFQKAIPPDESTLLTAGIVVGTTASLFLVDQSVKTFADRNHSSTNNDVLNIAEQYGATGNALVLSGSVYGVGLLFRSYDIRQTGSLLFESLFWTGAATSIIKYAFGRSRPYTDEGNTKFRGVQFNDDYLSFPSGHAAVAFALSSVLSERIQNTAASIGLYSLAGLTAAARVYHDDHWFSDIFLGAAIGTSIGIAVVHADEKDSNSSSAHIYILPSGFQFVLEF